jgi:hypothetical protein
MALLLDRAHVQVGPKASEEALARALSAVDYLPDAQVLAEALGTGAEYFASLDPKHLVGNPRTETLPIVLGTPGDFLDWYRQRLGQIE